MKGRLAAWGCLAALGLLLARSAEAAQAVRDGLALCAGSVIPALFPFLAVSGLLTALDAGASPALGPLARLLGSTDTILPYARSYLRIILLGAPYMTASFVLNNQLRFQGSAAYGMVGIPLSLIHI